MSLAAQVASGHYVPVLPSPLPDPKLVLFSKSCAAELGLSDEACLSKEFAQFFSGDVAAAAGLPGQVSILASDDT